ncbi:hypothetical protein N1851_017197 [Merluccius polli]|uniref:TTF-type domain-containing protein n=1 Tax=Merluccius polli TaxID=89951 RepID=A0AA47MPT9_MERPO|nr:hypothetical protein N1851_017197 [Merluccius polli]
MKRQQQRSLNDFFLQGKKKKKGNRSDEVQLDTNSEGESGKASTAELQGDQSRDRQLRDTEVRAERTESYQPHPKFIETQVLSNRTLSFQERWYKDFPWLHYDAVQKGVLCFYCMRVYQDKPTPFAVKSEPAFITSGFKNWKKAIEKFKAHESSHTHCHAVSVTAQENHPVNAQLSSALANTQSDNRHCLGKIMSSIKYLA